MRSPLSWFSEVLPLNIPLSLGIRMSTHEFWGDIQTIAAVNQINLASDKRIRVLKKKKKRHVNIVNSLTKTSSYLTVHRLQGQDMILLYSLSNYLSQWPISTASKHSSKEKRQDCSVTPSTNQDLKAHTLTKILVLYLVLNGILKFWFRFKRLFFLVGIASITYINSLANSYI